MKRRSFLKGSTLIGASAMQARAADEMQVFGLGDGIPHSPQDYSRLLAQLTAAGNVDPDRDSSGGVLARLEERFARLLGKETAVWMPTGTLANHLAVRLLAGSRRRVLLQAESHLYNDSGDCAQTLSGLTLVPLASGRASFTLEEVEQAAARSASGRLATPIGAIQIESPVRRRAGERFDYEQMRRVSAWARARGIGMHLDGARLLIEAVYSGVPLREYAALFDTVYVSLYKYLNAASGAILAGPKPLLQDALQLRRTFGGGLYQVWPSALVALHYLEGFEQRFAAAVATAEAVIQALSTDANFEIERISSGTNIFRMRVRGVNARIYQQRLELAGLTSRAPDSGEWFVLQVNETWNRRTAPEIVEIFRKALG